MNFDTQICTTKEQSERLLILGLKEETADMCLDNVIEGEWSPMAMSRIFGSQIPAWSLHRLIKMCPNSILDMRPCLHKTISDRSIFYCEENSKEEYEQSFSEFLNLYDNIIACIEWLIKEGYFNEKYLRKEKTK